MVTLHVSVWVEIDIQLHRYSYIASRSTWACELKYQLHLFRLDSQCHAPRERVSWNNTVINVWCVCDRHAPRERVSWNYRLKLYVRCHIVTLHVSVWVEIADMCGFWFLPASRSTWACELKCLNFSFAIVVISSRSTWACELKYQTATAVSNADMSRSTWACELKYTSICRIREPRCHAPRERVSWNNYSLHSCWRNNVTLHVSVWVEILHHLSQIVGWLSRSTWACELKFSLP